MGRKGPCILDGENVLDLFGGSGSTLIVTVQGGCHAFSMHSIRCTRIALSIATRASRASRPCSNEPASANADENGRHLVERRPFLKGRTLSDIPFMIACRISMAQQNTERYMFCSSSFQRMLPFPKFCKERSADGVWNRRLLYKRLDCAYELQSKRWVMPNNNFSQKIVSKTE